MSGVLSMVFAAIIALTVSASAAAPRRITGPDKFCEEVLSTISNKALGKTVDLIADSTGQPDSSTGALANTLKIFEGKTFDFIRKAISKDYNGGLRQIVYYSYVDKFGFFYFRFNFKMTSSGWILANFAFKDETLELFPKDFIDR
jgi:hypothetical protein